MIQMIGYKPELSVLVVTHSKPQLLVQFIRSIYYSSPLPTTEILVYQSGNPRNLPKGYLAAELQKDKPASIQRVTVIEDTINLGACVGVNALVSLAQGEYLFVCNDDFIVNANNWYQPLKRALGLPGVGVVCSLLINGGLDFSEEPTAEQMISQIAQVSAKYTNESIRTDIPEFIENESNQPWFLRREDAMRYASFDPIRNQQKFICEWIDPHGAGWATDWCLYHRVKLAGHKIGMAPGSVVYHYGHVSLKQKDKEEPGWTQTAMTRYIAKWQTGDKELNQNFENRQYIVQDDRLYIV